MDCPIGVKRGFDIPRPRSTFYVTVLNDDLGPTDCFQFKSILCTDLLSKLHSAPTVATHFRSASVNVCTRRKSSAHPTLGRRDRVAPLKRDCKRPCIPMDIESGNFFNINYPSEPEHPLINYRK